MGSSHEPLAGQIGARASPSDWIATEQARYRLNQHGGRSPGQRSVSGADKLVFQFFSIQMWMFASKQMDGTILRKASEMIGRRFGWLFGVCRHPIREIRL